MSTSERDDRTARAAQLLLDARATLEPIDPLTELCPGLSIDDAYDVQLAQVARWTDDGDPIKGYKVGLTAKAMQRQLGVDQPDFGHMTASMFHLERVPIDAAGFIQPKVEPEIAFVLGAELAGPGVTVAEAIRAVDYVLPALEIIDSRIKDWRITITDTIADNASCGGIVLGSHPVRIDAVDLARCGCNLLLGSEVVDTGAGGAVLGSPVNALVWLVNTLGSRGITFRPGDVVLPGSVTAAHPVAAGTAATAQFAGLGTVTAVFG